MSVELVSLLQRTLNKVFYINKYGTYKNMQLVLQAKTNKENFIKYY